MAKIDRGGSWEMSRVRLIGGEHIERFIPFYVPFIRLSINGGNPVNVSIL